MWVIASVCPTVGGQLGQIPCIFSHFCLIRPTHGNKRGSWNSFKTITPIFINYTGNTVKVRDIYGSFKTIRFLSRPLHFCVFWCINSAFLAPFLCNPSQTSPNMPKFKFSNSIVSIVPIVHPYEQI